MCLVSLAVLGQDVVDVHALGTTELTFEKRQWKYLSGITFTDAVGGHS